MADKVNDNSIKLLINAMLALTILPLVPEYLIIYDASIITSLGSIYVDFINNKLLPNHKTFKVLLLIFNIGSVLLVKNHNRKITVPILTVGAILLSASALYLFSIRNIITDIPLWVHAIIYPIAFLLYIISPSFIIPFFSNSTKVNNRKREDLIGISSKRSNKFDIELLTHEGPLVINAPFRHTWTIGSAGSGKSASIIDPFIFQAILSGFTGVVYDFKGSPLTETTYKSVRFLKENLNSKGEFAQSPLDKILNRKRRYEGTIPTLHLLNFTNPQASVRINPLDPSIINSSEMAAQAATTIALAIKKEWAKKSDFWTDSATLTIHSIIWNLAKNYPEQCTFPHVICVFLAKQDHLQAWLSEDEEIGALSRGLVEAIEKKADGQVQGTLGTSRTAVAKLFNKTFFWALSATDISLKLNDPDDPKLLCLCNNAQLQASLGPGLSIILSMLSTILNEPKKRSAIFAVDELPTVYINGLGNYMATCRSNRNAVLLGLQSYSQLENEYGKEIAATIRGNASNEFWGSVATDEGEKIAKSLGTFDRQRSNVSYSDSGSSTSYSFEKFDSISAAEIKSQKAGQFVGTVIDGEPPAFQTSFKMLEQYDPKIKKSFEREVEYPLLYTSAEQMKVLMDANFLSIQKDVKDMLGISYENSLFEEE